MIYDWRQLGSQRTTDEVRVSNGCVPQLVCSYSHTHRATTRRWITIAARAENFISFPKGQLINFGKARAREPPAIVNAPHVHAAEAAICNPLGKHAERDAYPTIFGTSTLTTHE
jgi:hypothetical protein